MQIDRVMAGSAIIAACIFAFFLYNSGSGIPGLMMSEQGKAVTIPPSATPAVIQETPTTQDTVSHGEYWAEIDPVPDIRLVQAENVTIHGTTNLPPGENITIDFFASSMHPSPEVYYPDLHFIAFAEVRPGAGETNTWSLTIQPQRFPKPDTYQILVSDQNGSIGTQSAVVTP